MNTPCREDGLDVLTKVGGFEIGALAGVVLGAAANRCAVVLDGLNTTAAAMIADALHPLARRYMFASHLSGEPAHINALEHLGLAPCIDMGIRLGRSDWGVRGRRDAQTVGCIAAEDAGECGRAEKCLRGRFLASCPLDEEAMSKCQERLDNLIKPLNSLGAFEMLARKMAGVTGLPRPKMLQSSLVLAAEGKSEPSLTAHVFAAHVGARLAWFDAGKGRGNSRGGMLAAIESGIRIAQVEVAKGSRILGLEPGEQYFCGGFHHQRQQCRSFRSGCNAGGGRKPGDSRLVGVILGAAAERAAVVLDDAATLAGALGCSRVGASGRGISRWLAFFR